MPPVEIVTGTLAEIEEALRAAIAAAKRPDPLAPVTVAVDNVLLKQQLPRAFALRGTPHLNVRYVTIDELAVLMASQAPGAAARERLTRDAERFLVRAVAATADGYFRPVAGRDGFADALGRLIRDLELGGFTPDAFASAALPRDKGRELAQLYREYHRRRGGAATRVEQYEAAGAAAPEGPLFVYGIWAPPEAQARFIERIAAGAAVTVFLPCAGFDADEAHAAFRARLLAAGAIERAAPATGSDGVARAIADRVFRAPGPPLDAPGVALVSAPDTIREVWEAARWCLDRAREGIAFHEMAVAYRNRDPYRALVDEVFGEAGIGAYLHDGRLLSEHPLGRRVIALLELAERHASFERVQVMEFLTETLLPRTTAARYGRVRPSEWEAHTREAGVIDGIDQWCGRLERLAAEKEASSHEEGREWLARTAASIRDLIAFMTDFHAALAERPDEASWDEHLTYLRALTERYADDVERIVDALADLRAIAAVRERVTFAEFARAVRDDLEQRDASAVLKEPERAFGRKGVAVVDASSLRHLRFRAVYLLGVAERAWPPPPRPDPLLLEHERAAINASGAGAVPLRTEPDAETLAFWLALQSATEHLALSYARADAGRSAKHLPSYFFRAVADALEGKRLTIEDLEWSACVRRIEAGRLAVDDLDASLSQPEYDRGLVRRSAEAAGAVVAALARETPPLAAAVRARAARWSPALTPHDGVMSGEDAVAAARARSPFARGDAVSASRLETYATCPYRYFLRYGLSIEQVEEPEAIERMDHLQRGSLIHEILQRFMQAIGRGDPPARTRRTAHLPRLLTIARECGEDRVRRGVAGKPLIWERDRREIEEDLVRWYDREADAIAADPALLPGAHEARFGTMPYGDDDEDPQLSCDEPLAITVAGRTMRVLGRIDRIDWDDARTRYRVIDYKTGKFSHVAGSFVARGEALQLPLYLLAASQMLGIAPDDGQAQYFHATGRGNFQRHTIDGATLRAGRAHFDQVLATIADGVDSGFFAPNPQRGHCQWCDYKDVCDRRIDRIAQRKRGDARGAAYAALEEIP